MAPPRIIFQYYLSNITKAVYCSRVHKNTFASSYAVNAMQYFVTSGNITCATNNENNVLFK